MMGAAVTLAAGAALAQYTTSMTTATSPAVTAEQGPVCMAPEYANPCPVEISALPTGSQVVLVLGTQERYGLNNVMRRGLNWRNSPHNYMSMLDPANPLNNWQPTPITRRYGNPFNPYYQVTSNDVRVAGMMERYGQGIAPENKNALDAVKARYEGLTTQQARLLGYQPVGVCTAGMGQIYLNQSLVDNTFNAQMPEAFSFDAKGRLASVQYILLSDVAVSAYGQPMEPSQLVANARQLNVWLYQRNPSGVFAMTNSNITCPPGEVAGVVESTTTPARSKRDRSPVVQCP